MNQLLKSILQTKRADKSVGDYLFRAWLLQHLSRWKPSIAGDGNIVVTQGQSRVAFSCHIDTCHSVAESDGSPQVVVEDMGLLMLGSEAGCLGADDGVGIFLMLEMLDAGVPGTYIFHTGEECGSEGSRSINEDCYDLLSTFDAIIAFDRAVSPGSDPEVIITQSGTPCASPEFGQALADALNAADQSLNYVVSTRGVFTDTLNYVGNVAECINIGCFYCDQHSPREFVDIEGLNKLLNAVITIDWDALPVQHKSEDLSLFDALTEALDGNQASLRVLMTEHIGSEYKYYIDRLQVDQQTVEDAYQMALGLEPTFHILDFVLDECSVT